MVVHAYNSSNMGGTSIEITQGPELKLQYWKKKSKCLLFCKRYTSLDKTYRLKIKE
jgi:hypothetical protein